jgi:hypothetical protein
MYTCRECERPINQASEICPYCGSDLTTDLGESTDATDRPALTKILLRWSLVLLPILAGLWGFLWFVLPEQRGEQAARAETSAREAMSEVRLALENYAAARGGSYPPSLDVLGDAARGPARKALSAGYELKYTAGTPNADGTVRTFTLEARPANYGYSSFFLDETGAVHSTRENRPATAQDPPVR